MQAKMVLKIGLMLLVLVGALTIAVLVKDKAVEKTAVKEAGGDAVSKTDVVKAPEKIAEPAVSAKVEEQPAKPAMAKVEEKPAGEAPAKAEPKTETQPVPPAAPAAAPDAAAVEKAIADAEAARQKAASVSGEWRDTASLIEKAKAAAKAGDFAEAVKQANKARKQGEAGYAQMMAQQEFRWPSFFKK